jgi:hypothetical protein
MKFLEVSDSDMKLFAQVINLLQAGKYELGGKDLCASGDAIRWLQKVAVSAAEAYSKGKTSIKEEVKPQVVSEVNAPLPEPAKAGLPEGVKIKAFNPGKVGKSK